MRCIFVLLQRSNQYKTNKMTNLTITVNGKNQGEKVFFILNIAKTNFLKVVDMNWATIEDVLNGEKNGYYTIAKNKLGG